jgi:WD40 repeat protein
MATGDMFSKIKIWDLNAQSERLDLVGHTGPVTCLAFSPNSESLASGGHDLTAFLWDVRSGAKKSVFPAQGHAIQSVAFFPDGSQLVIGEGVNQEGCQGHIRIWNTVNSELLRTITLPEQGMVNCVAYAPDGRTLASATWEDGSVTLWDTATGRRLQVLRAGGRDARSVAFDPQGRTLASCGVDGQVCIWRRSENNQRVQAFDELGKTRITTAAVSPDGRIIAAGSHRAICFWDLGPDLVDGEVGVHEEVACLEFSPDGSLLACATQRSGKLLLFSTRDRKPLLGIDADPKAARVVAFTPDGQIVATGCANGSVKLWEVGSGVLRHRFDCHTSEVVDVAFSPDGRLLASIGLVGHAAKVWTVATGQEYVTLPGHEATDPVEGKAVAFSPDGRTLEITRYSRHSAAWGTERWDLTGEPILHEFVAREASGGHVRAYAPDGGSVASVSQGTVRVRNSRNGELQRAITITPHLGIVRQLLFTPDGRHLITANGNGTVYILRLAPYQSRAAK